ncbi:MAG: 30S ribosomal protein S2 [Candidatus Parcubacteria bacterium]|nr:MAG: 30S ribosomal protein S2 [Candidatus Parcubacteria bacterium]
MTNKIQQQENETTSLNKNIFEEMMKAGVHYGRAKRFTHPLMKPFLLKTNKKIELFNLKITLAKIKQCAAVIKNHLEQNKTILFIGVAPASQNPIQRIATTLNQPYVNFKWVGGFLTNFQTIQARLIYFKNLLQKEANNELKDYFPKERSKIEKEIQKLKNIYSGVIDLNKLPDLTFIVNLNFPAHITAKRESLKMKIPIMAITGSDNNISNVDFIMPANDKAPKSINWIIDKLIQEIKNNQTKTSEIKTDKPDSNNNQ